jgi:hypothetical protein
MVTTATSIRGLSLEAVVASRALQVGYMDEHACLRDGMKTIFQEIAGDSSWSVCYFAK